MLQNYEVFKLTKNTFKNPGDLPVGQKWIKNWPVRTVESGPEDESGSWSLKISGMVDKSFTLSIQEVKGLKSIEIVRDFHCVETWSIPNIRWKGVPVTLILELAKPFKKATYAIASSLGGYKTDLKLETLLSPDTLLVWEANGMPLSPDHGYPLRLIIPDLYAYKSVKWVSEINITDRDIPGYWEEKGYHRNADVWKGERFQEDRLK